MKLTFNDIIDKHKSKAAIVFGNGPSSRPYVKIYERLSKDKDNFVFLGCNSHHLMIDTDTDYWFVCNPIDTIKKRYKWFNTKPNCTLVYADSVDLTDKKFIDKVLKCNYLPYDQRHFNGKPCHVCKSYGCGKFFDKNRLTLQEELKLYTKSPIRYNNGDSVILHVCSLAVLLGCDPIYVAGVDLDYTDPYLNNKAKKPWVKDGGMSKFRENIIRDFGIIKEMADNIGVKIFTTVNNGHLVRSLPYKDINDIVLKQQCA